MVGFKELEDERRQLSIMQTRKTISWLLNIQLAKGDHLEESDIWPLPLDEEIEQERRKQMPISTVTLGETE